MKHTSSRGALRLLLLTLAGLVVVFILVVRFAYTAPADARRLGLDEIYRQASERRVAGATFLDQDAQVRGLICRSGPAPCPAKASTAFYAPYPASDVSTQALIEVLARSGAKVGVDAQSSKGVAKLVASFVLPLVFLANLFGIILVSRGADSSIADIAGFGTIARRRQRRSLPTTGVTFADVAGADEAVAELKEVVDYLTDPERFEALGATPPKGVLLFGPPGCGKTLLARAAAGESGVAFFSISGAEFVESLVGVGAARVRDLFAQVRQAAPAIVFIDEIDAVGRRRAGEGVTGGEREQTVNQLLIEMDGFDPTAGVVVMAATNRPDILDQALLRPGRFDRHITMEAPDLYGREAILAIHARLRPVGPDVDLASVARRTPGFTGADLANVVNESALVALRDGAQQISALHFSEAIVRVLHGPQRRGKLMADHERRRIAYHEAGHAVVAAAVGEAGGLDRVSILATGKGLASTVLKQEDERVLFTDYELRARLAIALAGVAAEQAMFDSTSTAAEHDLKEATAMAREMVARYGMSELVGRVHLAAEANGYLGAELDLQAVSEATMGVVDAEVRALLATAESQATTVLEANEAALQRLAEALEEHETLEGTNLEELLSSVEVDLAISGASNPSRPNGSTPPRAPARL